MNKPLSLWLLNLQIALRFLSTALVPLWVVRALIEKASNKDKHWKEICIMAFADEMQHGRLNDFLFIISITTIIALPFYLLFYWRGIDDRGIVFLVLSAIVAYLAIRREWKNDYKDRHDFKVFCSWPVSKRCLYVFLGLCLCTVASLIIIFIYFA